MRQVLKGARDVGIGVAQSPGGQGLLQMPRSPFANVTGLSMPSSSTSGLAAAAGGGTDAMSEPVAAAGDGSTGYSNSQIVQGLVIGACVVGGIGAVIYANRDYLRDAIGWATRTEEGEWLKELTELVNDPARMSRYKVSLREHFQRSGLNDKEVSDKLVKYIREIRAAASLKGPIPARIAL